MPQNGPVNGMSRALLHGHSRRSKRALFGMYTGSIVVTGNSDKETTQDDCILQTILQEYSTCITNIDQTK